MNLAEAVAKRTKELMFDRGVTQYKLIKKTCLDKTTIQTLFKNKTKDIRLSTVFLIADVFDMTISQFTDAPYFTKINIEL